MFQKSCLFKCIQSSSTKLNLNFSDSQDSNSGRKNLLPNGTQWNIIKKRINNSIGSIQKCRKKTTKVRAIFYPVFYDVDSDSDEDYDDDDDDDIFLNSIHENDLNSSLSSVSSLEFEPFESIPIVDKKTSSHSQFVTDLG